MPYSYYTQVLDDLGGVVNVWNIHLYGDLCLRHQRRDGRSLLQDFRCGTLIFLNNACMEKEALSTYGLSLA